MKIHKKVIDILAKRKIALVADIFKEAGLFEKQVFNFEEFLNEVDQVCYTIEFLEREEIISIKGKAKIACPTLGNFGKFPEIVSRHLFFTQGLLEQHYDNYISINTTFFDFIKNNYQTERQKEARRIFWLPVGIAILASFLTALFSTMFK